MLEPHPELRGSYSASKQEAEALVLAARASLATRVVVLRPGTIYGPGGDPYTPLMGFQIGDTYAVIRSRGYVLPFVHVENVVDAMITCLHRQEANGQVYNVIDPEPLTKPRYMNDVIRRLNPSARVLPMPYAFLYTITWFQELAFKAMKRRPVLTRYRLAASQRAVVYDGSRIMKHLGWTPPVRLEAALESLITGEVSGARITTSLPGAALAQSTAR
jgi:nucleoside-diphosphate-sugar epimerase